MVMLLSHISSTWGGALGTCTRQLQVLVVPVEIALGSRNGRVEALG